MGSSKKHRSKGSGDFILERVLEAEKQAESRIAKARKDAAELQLEASAASRAISAKTDRRIQVMYQASLENTARLAQRLTDAFETEKAEHEAQAGRVKVKPAVDRLVHRLSGGGSG